jgi:carboxypeptidase C (cathepsin A)
MLGLLVENGPCFVNPDSNSTTLNPWSWNNEGELTSTTTSPRLTEAVNMLYVDQPNQVGLSYDVLTNISVNLVSGDITILNDTDSVPEQNATFLTGTYPSQDGNSTTQGSIASARSLWNFIQSWTQEFPYYMPNDNRVSIATESYGGRYGPAFMAFWEEQNQRIENGTWNDDDGEMKILHLDTLLIINGCIDRQVQWPSYPHMAYNNTYGIQAVNESVYNYMMDAYYGPGGCRDQVARCRELASRFDVNNTGINDTVNEVCADAENFCSSEVRGPYLDYSGRNYYDIRQLDPDPMTQPFYEGFLNQPHVQADLGVPLNWTQSSGTVSTEFRAMGDYPRPGWIEDLAFLLDNDIKVTLMYADADFACNCIKPSHGVRSMLANC